MGVWGSGGYRMVSPHMCTCMHMHTHMYMHIYMLNMITSIANGCPHWILRILGIPYDVIHACICMHVHVRGGILPPPRTPIYPPPFLWGTAGISKNSITLELIEIFQFCLKIWNLWRLPYPWVGVWFGGWVGGWVGWWVGSGQITKNFKNVDSLKIKKFYSVWRFMICKDTPTQGWVCGWMGGWVGSGQMTKNLINLDLIKIIQFCLKIYDL